MMFIIRGRLAGKALPESVPEAMFRAPPAPVEVPAEAVVVAAASTAALVVPGVDDSDEARTDEPPPPYQENVPEDTVTA